MSRRIFGSFLVMAMVMGWHAGMAQAGAEIKISEDAKIDLGFRLQTLYINTERDLDNSGSFETDNDFKVRRARIRLGADVTDMVGIFLQTEFSEDEAGTGGDVRLIDAFVKVAPNPWLQLIGGENMAASLRQNLTSSGALMAIDRPGIIYKNLTWGARSLHTFSNATYADSDSGLRGTVDVRDMGATLFGEGGVADNVSLKYYLGIYDGVQQPAPNDKDNLRYAARVQVNLFDPEPGYYNLSTYLGKKKTVGFGLTYDSQDDVVVGSDYTEWSIDAFTDYPVGPGSLTVEAAYINLDLDDNNPVLQKAEGDGFYIQGGYFWNNWQPWLEYETWSSEAANDLGSYDCFRFGVSYFLKGHNANVKAGYEIFNTDQNFTYEVGGSRIPSTEDSINSFVVGLYVTY